MAAIETRKITQRPTDRKYAWYLVLVDGVEVGLLEKWANTRTDTHPWKGFGLCGADGLRPFFGAYYPVAGGRKAALAAVLAAHRATGRAGAVCLA